MFQRMSIQKSSLKTIHSGFLGPFHIRHNRSELAIYTVPKVLRRSTIQCANVIKTLPFHFLINPRTKQCFDVALLQLCGESQATNIQP